jgi:hypothetical protein
MSESAGASTRSAQRSGCPAAGDLLLRRRAHARRGAAPRRPDRGEDILRVRYRDLEALCGRCRTRCRPWTSSRCSPISATVESAMRRGTVLPAPFGIVFRGRRQLIRMLQEQYLVLDEGLSFLEGHWELRLHIDPAEDTSRPRAQRPRHAALFRAAPHARAAVPFPRKAGVCSARRSSSNVHAAGSSSWTGPRTWPARTREITFDITGPGRRTTSSAS